MERSKDRAAHNETLFRDANERIERRRRELGVEDPTPYICECSHEACLDIVRMPAAEYLAVRSDPTHFLQVPGHADDTEVVVAEHDGYVIVEKTGRAAETARGEA